MKVLELLQNPMIVAAVSGLGIAIIDFLFAINPNLKSNGILHALVVLFTKDAGSSQSQ